MATTMTAEDVLGREFLSVRAKLLDVAAVLDRIDRAEGTLRDDPRLGQIRRALQALTAEESDRAETLQLIFSLPYNENWQSEYEQ